MDTVIKNPNHPKKGSRITVEPFRNINDIKLIVKMLKDKPRDHLLFVLGINNGLRAGDLLKLRVKDVRHLKAGDQLVIKESKTGVNGLIKIPRKWSFKNGQRLV